MNETRYMISDTSRQLKVEPHVLRYWEDELDMKIKRNEMGHRYYTVDDIRVLQTVREMKDQGFQLKAIKQILPELYTNPNFNYMALFDQREALCQSGVPASENAQNQDVHTKPEESMGTSKVVEMDQLRASHGKGTSSSPKELAIEIQPPMETKAQTPVDMMSAELKMEQFQEIMTKIIGKAMEANNRSLTGAISNEVSDQVSERVIKQMDYVMREREEREEERFRKLDEAIRVRQRANAEAAAAIEDSRRKKKKKMFGKKTKPAPRVMN